jgi:hypothetical protein
MRVYNETIINDWIEKCKRKEVLHYGDTDPLIYIALEKYSIKNNNVLIIGSEAPCYESLALLYDANSITVVDYEEIESTHEKIKILSVPQFESNNDLYDCAFSISSVEHSGLGRYGDPIDIDGDLKSMRVLYDRIKPNGICFFSVPIGTDHIEGILHRVYGKNRLPLLLDGWNVLERFGFNETMFKSYNFSQPLFILQK